MEQTQLEGIIFDMDGTLIEPAIDFGAMREAVGIPEGDILEVLAKWEPGRRREALARIEAVEAEAAARMELTPGLEELLAWAREMGVRCGLVTRNNRRTVELLVERVGPVFAPALDRSFTPPKPDPAPLLNVLERWEATPERVVMVGDSGHDLSAARAAGVRACLLCRSYNEEHHDRADWVIERLDELPRVLAL